ncbi:fatty acyl-CoA reductase wat-like [Cylas formicarius]|uniref:fatty acyl-CoA reductase wat-like n=1 Tax=Cylas formicarius TaxID=197179 RepID=UPI0029584413|nr:fatty acyl-CoA reductase wat-like [Cylas formicarius]
MTSPVKNFYKNQNVLLTGGTGFFGKMIMEKLLRTTEINCVYLIVRQKKDVGFEKRATNLIKEEIFSNIDDSKGGKWHAIEGDLREEGLGLTDDTKQFLRENINIVFHCGASLNMNASLADAVMTNVNGTAELLEVMKGATSLKAFVQVSTAYSNCLHKTIEEKLYEPPIDPELLIKIAKEMKPELLNSISKGFVGQYPNSYVFTKSVAENLLQKKGGQLPIGLFRPTIVTSAVSEPFPGWTDNVYGPLGILLSEHCGILRVARGNGSIKADTVPGDMVINALLCFAWDVYNTWVHDFLNYEPKVLNFSGYDSPLYISIKEYTDRAAASGFPPFKKAIWSPVLYIVENKHLFNSLSFVLQTVPAFVFDTLLMLTCQKPRMRKIYSKIAKLSDVLSYFVLNEWTIKNNNVKALWEKLSPADRVTFHFDLSSINVDEYLKNILMGLKKYILKEDMSKIEYHKERYRRLLFFHKIVKYLFVVLLSFPILKALLLYFARPLLTSHLGKIFSEFWYSIRS